jgi:hypothetical protein
MAKGHNSLCPWREASSHERTQRIPKKTLKIASFIVISHHVWRHSPPILGGAGEMGSPRSSALWGFIPPSVVMAHTVPRRPPLRAFHILPMFGKNNSNLPNIGKTALERLTAPPGGTHLLVSSATVKSNVFAIPSCNYGLPHGRFRSLRAAVQTGMRGRCLEMPVRIS